MANTRNGTLRFGGKKFTWIAEIVDTYYGPENHVRLFYNGIEVFSAQEPMATLDILVQWMEDMKEGVA